MTPFAALETWHWALIGLALVVAAWAAAVAVLLLLGRRAEARAVAAFVPDCLVLMRRLIADPRVSRRRKAAMALAVAYLALPFDLIPDFLPVLGQVDDALVVIVVLRYVLRSGGGDLLVELWPGPPDSLRLVLRLAGLAPQLAATGRPTLRSG